MMRKRLILVLALAAAVDACGRRGAEEPVFDTGRGGLTPEQAIARMKLAPGFSVSLVASEPDIRQPVALNWDDRGRLWVVEYIQYPDPAGLKALEWDRYFRTKYDRIPEPPPKGARGRDRIKILEDTNGDGRIDKVKIFVDGLNLASGVAVGYGGVYVAQSPYLLYYADRDADDRPDGPPEVLLKYFGMEDAHAVVNSLTWGPDGWLYGAQGSTVTANIRGHSFQQGIWRFHPVTREFELFAEGGGNTWSFDWDENGHLLCGTNYSKYVLLHIVQGGYYVKTFEKHGPLSNPYAFGYFPHAEHRGPFKGGHVTIGGLTYQAGAYSGFRGKHIAANILSNVVYWYDVEPIGSTFATRLGGELLAANDEWFRPVDLTVGPDGCVYTADWYDIRATHNNTREDTWDKTSGRIYRIEVQSHKPAPKFRLSGESSHRLVDRLRDPNEWFHREARRILAERRDSSIVPRLRQAVYSAKVDHEALEHLWALYVSGGLDEALAREFLDHPCAPVRFWTVRFLGDARSVSPETLDRLATLAEREPDPHVRSQLAASSRQLPPAQAVQILARLILRDEDASDRQIPLLLWWAIERHVKDQRESLVGLLASPAAWRARVVQEHLTERLARRLASAGSDADFSGCARLLASAPDRTASDRVLAGIDAGLAGRSFDRPPVPLAVSLEGLWNRGAQTPVLQRVAARLGNRRALESVRGVALGRGSPPTERAPVIDLLGQIGGRANLQILESIASRDEPEAILLEAIKALGRFSEPEIADTMLRRSVKLGAKVRDRTFELLASRKEWAARLLDYLGPEFRKEPASRVQKMLQLGDPELRARIEKSWGRIAPAGSPEKAERARQLAGIVGPPDLFTRPGRRFDQARGREIFDKRCSRCHTLFSHGGTIGPDLTGAERRNIEVLMLAVVDPSAAIRKEHASFLVTLSDGQVLTGVIQDPTPESIVVVDSEGERTIVARRDVRDIKESQTSLMPDGLLDDLDSQSLVDLFSYLTGKEGSPLSNADRAPLSLRKE